MKPIVRGLSRPAGVLLASDAVDDRAEPHIDGQKLADSAQRLSRTASSCLCNLSNAQVRSTSSYLPGSLLWSSCLLAS